MTQRMILINSPYFISEENLHKVDDWSEVFGNDHPLSLEIGCGTGHFVVECARRNPERNYLAIDIFNRGCFKTCNRVEQAGLTNVRVARAEARFLMAHFLPPNSLSQIFINCPDPWPKKRHRRRRLVNEPFLDLARYVLKRDGDLYFTSDFEDYAVEVAMRATEHPNFSQARPAPVALDIEGYPRSKYMRRFLDRNEPIYFVHFRCDKPEGAVLPPPPVEPGFRLLWAVASDL
jgi:tRNA (guanine-N7-)-methyltransferase